MLIRMSLTRKFRLKRHNRGSRDCSAVYLWEWPWLAVLSLKVQADAREIVLIVLPTMVIAMGDGIMDMGIHMAANSVEMEDAVGSAT